MPRFGLVGAHEFGRYCDFFVWLTGVFRGANRNVITVLIVWKASGHVENFTDPMTVCKSCNSRVRVDQLLEATLTSQQEIDAVAQLSLAELDEMLVKHDVACPSCREKGTFLPAKKFNLLFRTNMGATEETW